MASGNAVRIAVVEDAAAERDTLTAMIERYCSDRGIAVQLAAFANAEALLGASESARFDLLFLDIGLPGMSGIDAARRLRQSDPDAQVVFITVSPDFQAEGFEVWASGYVLKPVTPAKVSRAMHACRFLVERAARVLELPGPAGTNLQLSVSDLLYAEVYYKRTVLHTTRGDLTLRLPLAQLEERLGGTPFLKCHRSFIVNLARVEDVAGDHLVMRGGDRVPIRQHNRRDIALALARFIAGPQTEVG